MGYQKFLSCFLSPAGGSNLLVSISNTVGALPNSYLTSLWVRCSAIVSLVLDARCSAPNRRNYLLCTVRTFRLLGPAQGVRIWFLVVVRLSIELKFCNIPLIPKICMTETFKIIENRWCDITDHVQKILGIEAFKETYLF